MYQKHFAALFIVMALLIVPSLSLAEENPEFQGSERLAGVWQDESTKCLFTIENTSNGPILTGILDDDGERFRLRTYELKGADWVAWSYYVPSTGYSVSYECMNKGDKMECIWSNDHGMLGTENLPRVQ